MTEREAWPTTGVRFPLVLATAKGILGQLVSVPPFQGSPSAPIGTPDLRPGLFSAGPPGVISSRG